MKKMSVCICCYNEEGNVYEMYTAVTKEMQKFNEVYDYEIIFSDNDSKDQTRSILRKIAKEDKHVKVIFNARNFGPNRSGWNCTFRASGDVLISIPCDFQSPPEQIPEFIHLWENGNLVICGQKVKSKENKLKFFFRQVFYRIIKSMSDIPQYDNLVGLTVIDRKIADVLKENYEPDVEFRFLIAELGYKIKIVPYVQQVRKAGRSSYNIARYFDFAVSSLINTSCTPLRMATVAGMFASGMCFFMGMAYLIYKLTHWYSFYAGTAPLLIGMFFIGSIQLLFTGIVGEYVGTVLRKIHKSPVVIEEEVLNFDE